MKNMLVSHVAILLIAVFTGKDAQAQFPDLDKLKLPTVPDMKEVSDLEKLVGGGTGCIVGGAVGYFGGKEFSKLIGEDRPLTEEEEKRFLLGAALAGCAVGGAAGVKIVENMSESAKQAQLEAWNEAQQGTGPVNWVDPNDDSTRGTTELVEIETLPSGEKCGFRRDVISTAEGTVEPEQRVCQSEAGGWEPRFS